MDTKKGSNTKKSKLQKAQTFDLGDSQSSQTKKRIEIEYEGLVPRKHIGKNKDKFDSIYEKIQEMRKQKNAPVDTMGACSTPDPNASKDTQKFQLLISLMLSVQTKDEITAAAMEALKKKGLTPDNIHKIEEQDLIQTIFKCNFNKTKAKNIKNVAKQLVEDLNYKLPETLQGITKFPGVGPKIGVLYLNHGLGQTMGIGVDTHVHRISNRVGWVNTKTPEETRFALQEIVPRKQWEEINVLLVGFGQQTCTPINPKCHDCVANQLCLEGRRNVRKHKPELKKPKKGSSKQLIKSKSMNIDFDDNEEEEEDIDDDADTDDLEQESKILKEIVEEDEQEEKKDQEEKGKKKVVRRKSSRSLSKKPSKSLALSSSDEEDEEDNEGEQSSQKKKIVRRQSSRKKN